MNTAEEIQISVVMPVYNSEEYLRDAIDSVLNQVDAPSFEFIIINDGSTDKSEDIITSYNDSRIIYLFQNHLGISNALNYAISVAQGNYIVRFDADDIMFEDRLSVQFNYMESHPECDICGFGMTQGSDINNTELWGFNDEKLNLETLLEVNCISHPTVIMKRIPIVFLPYIYESYFDGCEDYKLWCRLADNGFHISSVSTPVIFHRCIETENSVTHYNEIMKYVCRIQKAYNRDYSNMNNELTIIIPFRNEGYEVEKTVFSIRATTTNLPIILINDGSKDLYDYKHIAEKWNCTYITHNESKGVGRSRDKGVKKCKTEYFVILDAHMRFYEDNWESRVLEVLKSHKQSIICSDTITISKNSDRDFDEYKNEKGTELTDAYGAVINFDEPGCEFTAKWNYYLPPVFKDKNIIPIICVFGAFYASSKHWWNHIYGLNGLILWGQDEPLLSIKTLLANGAVLLIKDFKVGHVYRVTPPYEFTASKIYSNSIMLNHLFLQDDKEIELYDNRLKEKIGDECFNKSMKLYKQRETQHNKFKDYFWKHIAVHSLDWFKELNNKYKQ